MKPSAALRQVQQGFTLLELMIVTAIIGILASVAVPSYQAYVYRAKATEIVVVMDKVREVLANLEAETGARLSKPIFIKVAVSTYKDPQANAYEYCIKPDHDSSCSVWKPLNGVTNAETTFPHLGVRLSTSTGVDRFTKGVGNYKVAVMEYEPFTVKNPAMRTTAQQTIMAVHHIMRPHTYRDALDIDIDKKHISSAYLYMNINGTRP